MDFLASLNKRLETSNRWFSHPRFCFNNQIFLWLGVMRIHRIHQTCLLFPIDQVLAKALFFFRFYFRIRFLKMRGFKKRNSFFFAGRRRRSLQNLPPTLVLFLSKFREYTHSFASPSDRLKAQSV